MYDVIIVGAGPAGLTPLSSSGAVCEGAGLRHGHPRNAASRAMHGFLTRDGMPPSEFLRTAREQMRQYSTVEFLDAEVIAAQCVDGRFEVTLNGGLRHASRKLLIATGVSDNLPEIPGFRDLYGIAVFHCPYCDGWELRNRPLAIDGRGARGYGLSLELTGWSRDLVLCTDGPCEWTKNSARG